MKRWFLLVFLLFLFLACARVREEMPFSYRVTAKDKKGVLLLDVSVKGGDSYSERVSLLKENLRFSCVFPDVASLFKEKAYEVFPDFELAFAKGEGAVSVVVEPSFAAELQGGLVFKSDYLVKALFRCTAHIKGRLYDCSCSAWKVYSTSEMEKAASFCPEHPVEYLIASDVAPVAVEKCLIRLRRGVLEAFGYPVDKKLEALSQEFYEEWLRFSK